MTQTEKTDSLLALIRNGKSMTLGQQLRLTVQLSIPAVIAQLSSIVMQYIDASMVGSLGAEASASIGLVSTTTWLFWGLCVAAATGFSVQVAHKIGAGDMQGARAVLRQSLTSTLVFSLLLSALGATISGSLPGWLGGDISIRRDASLYFCIFSFFLPALQMNFLAGGMLRCSGNMHAPSVAGVAMCILDVIFNFFLIFPSREWNIAGVSFTIPGAGLGVGGAALGTAA
uniref:MATE family efflux transporter n=1 Tax=uncultured Bacteroides sp. TaxID=162156 RepID=UPI00280ABD2E